jgi:hypothetical protein
MLVVALWVAASASTSSPFGINAHIPAPRLVERIDEIGVGWARIDFVWAFVEPERDVYDWSLYDRVIADLDNRGVRMFATIAGTPAWATSGPEFSGPPDDEADWRDLCARAADRYRGRVRAWGMWNEPNLTRFWTGSRRQYLDAILRAGAEAIRAADPEALVVGPDLAHLSSGDWDAWLFDVAVNGRDVLDVIVHHVYPSDDLASDVTDKLVSGGNLPIDPPAVREVLESSGWWGRPFWLGETGVSTNPPNSESVQDQFYIDLLRTWFAPGGRDWVDKVFFYELADDPSIEDAWGLVGPPPDYEPKRAFSSYREFIKGATYDDATIDVDPGPLFVGSLGEVRIVFRLQNTGTSTWSIARGDRLRVSVDRLSWTVLGGALPAGREVRPGGTVEIPVTVRVPRTVVDEPVHGLVVARMMDRQLSRFGDAATVSVVLSDATPPDARATVITRIVPAGAATRFEVEPLSPAEVTTLQWRRNTVPLIDDASVSGATGPALTLTGVDGSSEGIYDCLVTTSAGSIAVPAGRIRVVATATEAAGRRRAEARRESVIARWRTWRLAGAVPSPPDR